MNVQPSCEVIVLPTQFEPPQNEVPKSEHAQTDRGPLTNFFPLTHDLFLHPKIRALTGDGFRIFLWLNARAWQFPTSNGHIQASVGRLSRETGISEANVSRTLGALREQGLISLVRNDYKYGNIWEVQNLARARTKEPAQIPQNEGAAPSKRENNPIKMSEEHPQIEGEVINKKSKEKKESLSQAAETDFLRSYIAELKPQKKRESEGGNLKLLLADYTPKEVELALRYLLDSGLPGSGQKCHSPMSYLAHAMAQVLAEARARTDRTTHIARQLEATRKAETRRLREEAHDAEAAALREAAFCKALATPEQQEAWIKKFAEAHPVLRSCGPALRSLAIHDWCSTHQTQ